MLKYNLVEAKKDELIYEYFVEGRELERGLASIDLNTGEAMVEELAETDKSQWYALHLLSTLRTQYRENNYQNSGMVAWYQK